eukprot:792322-Prymnesium_polylepis.1
MLQVAHNASPTSFGPGNVTRATLHAYAKAVVALDTRNRQATRRRAHTQATRLRAVHAESGCALYSHRESVPC